MRVGDRGDEVGRPGPGGRHADADLAGDDRVPLGRVARPLLVPDQDVPDLLGVIERVVRGRIAPPGMPKRRRRPPLERRDERLGSGQFGVGLGHLCLLALAGPVPGPGLGWYAVRPASFLAKKIPGRRVAGMQGARR